MKAMPEPRVVTYEHMDRAVDHLRAPAASHNSCCYGAAFTDGERCTCWTPIVEPEPTAEVQEGPMPVNTARCHDCAYRRDSPERQALGGDSMPYIPGGVFTCHVGMPKAVAFVHPCGERVEVPPGTENDDYRPITRGDRAWQADGRPAVVCAGWASDDRAYQNAQALRERTDGRMPDMWLPYPRRELVARGRCPDCGFHEPTQGHREHCPNHEERR